MIEFYPQIKFVHVTAVVVSGLLFLLRGLLLQGGFRVAMAAPVRYLSYSIDTVLLAAAFMLLAMLPFAVYANGWLVLKVSLLIVYIVLGTFALKRGSTVAARRLFFVVALLTYLCMIAIARTHDPLGPWLTVKGWFV